MVKKYKDQQGKSIPLVLKVVFVLIFFGNIFVLKSLKPSRFEIVHEPTEIPVNYTPISLSHQFEQIWVKIPVFTRFDQDDGNIHLIIRKQAAFLLGDLEYQGQTKPLLYINLSSGEIIQRIRFPHPPNGSTPTTIAVNSKFVYVGFDGTQKISGNTKWGAGKVVAYDVNSGREVWSQTIGGAKAIESIVTTENAVSVRGSSSSRCYLFDSATGNVIETREEGDQNCIWFLDGAITYEESPLSAFQATNTQTGDIIWQSEIHVHAVEQPPILTQDVIVARIGDADMPTSVFALDKATGKLLWEYANTLGNVTVGNSVVYLQYLRQKWHE